MTKRLLAILLILAIVVIPLIPAGVAWAAPTNKDFYETDAGAGAASIYSNFWYAQTFLASSTYLASSVKIKSYITGTPGNATVYIHDTNPETGEPTGAAIATGIQDTVAWPSTEGTRAFNEITFDTPVILVEGETYAIVIKTDGANSSNCVKWQRNQEVIPYVGGAAWQSTDSGVTWYYFAGEASNRDFLFQVWGEVDATYPVMTTNAATSVTDSSATLNGTLTDLGAGASDADTWFEWGYLNGTYEFTTTPVNKGSVPSTCQETIDLPVGGRVYKYRLVAENDLSKESYGVRVLFTSLAPPSTVAADNYVARQGSITHVFQRKGWYAVERNWIIYCKSSEASPDGGFYWQSSADGSDWTDPYLYIEAENGSTWGYPIGGGNEADELNVYFDGTYLHAVYVWNRNIPIGLEPTAVSNNLWYRRGVPETAGTITWTSDWVIALARNNTTVKGYASIVTDTNGYPFIDYWESEGITTAEGSNYATPSGQWDRKVIRSTTKDGTFTATTPYTLKETIGARGTGTLVQLLDGQLYWVGCGEAQTPDIAGRLWNGSTWGSEEEIADDAHGKYRFSVVTRGDIVYVVYTNDDKDKIKFAKRLDTGWTTPIDIVIDLPISGDYYVAAPAMTINGATGDLYVFYQNFTTNHIFYIKYTNSTEVWEVSVDWLDESHNLLAYDDISTTIGSFLEVYGGEVGVYYLTAYPSWVYSAAAQHDIDLRYAYFSVEAGPAVQTNDAASITETSAILQGYLINDGGETCSVRFQWGTDIIYGTDTAWQGGKETGATFNESLTGLTADTTYYFRAQAKWPDGTTTSGSGKIFATEESDIPPVTISPPTNLIATRGDTQVALSWTRGANAINTLVRRSTTTYPILITEGTQVYFGTSTGVIDTGLSDTQGYYYSAWSEADGTYSTSYVTAYSAPLGGAAEDILAYPDELFITDVVIFQNYQEENDQIIVFRYSVTYNAGDPSQLPAFFFAFELYDGATLTAKAPVKAWGHRPGSIYLIPDNALTVNQSFTLKIIGIAGMWVTRPEYTESISSENWDSSPANLTDLDVWVWTEAEIIDTTWVTTTPTGQVLTDEGCAIFNAGIPGLSSVRTNICSSSGGYIPIEEEVFDAAYEESLSRDETLGTYVSAFIDDTAEVLHTDSSTSGTLIIILVCMFVAMVVGVITKDFGFVCAAVFPILVFGNFAALIPFAATMIAASVVVVYTVKRVWM